MSRLRRIVHGAASGYAVLLAAAVYSLASYPLAIHYLAQKRFALWVLMSSIGGYLNLIDLGMSASVARLLIDHKDEREAGSYGSFIKTGWLVLAVQGAILLAVGLALAPLLGTLLDIPADLRSEFVQLMCWQSTALAIGLALRISSHLLYAHQRIDVMNYTQMGSLVLNFALLWFFFHAGEGVLSLAWANLVATLSGAVLSLAVCWRLNLFPPVGAWGAASWHQFKELFGYGKDLFLVAVGIQMIMASQTMIITRRMDIAAVALWGVGTRAFALISQMVYRVANVSAPAISEMMVRGEQALLRQRYQALLSLTGSLGAVAAVGYALCNSSFVTVWMNAKFAWPVLNDVLLGIWMLILGLVYCHSGFASLTKQIGFMRYVYFIEGLVFISAAFLWARSGGFPAVITCSIICSTLFSGAYGVRRVSRYFDVSFYEVGLRWLAPMARLLALFVPVGIAGWWASGHLARPIGRLLLAGPFAHLNPEVAAAGARLVFNALLTGSVGVYLFLRYGLSAELQREFVERAPKPLGSFLRRIFLHAPQPVAPDPLAREPSTH